MVSAKMKTSSPLALSSFISSIAPGGTQLFSTNDLRPRAMTPVLVDAVHFAVYGVTSNPSSSDVSWRGLAKFKINLGRIIVTDGFVPMWMFTPIRQGVTELGGYFTWILPRPLLISPVQALNVEMFLSPSAPGNASAYVSFTGQALACDAVIPREIDVPYVSCWDTTSAAPGSTGFYSPPLTLYNATKKALQVQRIIGRIQANNANSGDDTTLIQLWNYDNREITNGPFQWLDVFPRQTRMLPYCGVLPPNTHLQARLQTQPSTSYQPMISIIGVRKESPS